MNYEIYGVAGFPISHSLSPALINPVLQNLNQKKIYRKILCRNVDDILKLKKILPLEALNLTAPLKEKIIPKVAQKSEAVQKIGAANCYYLTSSLLDNTDYFGVLKSAENVPLEQIEKVVVLGAGGAAKACAFAFQNKSLIILNRTLIKAKKIAERYDAKMGLLEEMHKFCSPKTLFISTLPKSVRFHIPYGKGAYFLDANYNDRRRKLQTTLRKYKYTNGAKWLSGQAYPFVQKITAKKDLILRYPMKTENAYNLALIGFMGAGKSYVGRLIAKKLGWKFVDLDKEIMRSEKMSIQDIFKRKGETYFRLIESILLVKFASTKQIVLSCGGGIIEEEKNREILNKQCYTYWLIRNPQETYRTLSNRNRPKIKTETDFLSLFQNRIDKYALASNVLYYNKEVETAVEDLYYDFTSTFSF